MISLIYMESLCIDGIAKARGDDVVVLMRRGLEPAREWELMTQLLTPAELAQWMSQPRAVSA